MILQDSLSMIWDSLEESLLEISLWTEGQFAAEGSLNFVPRELSSPPGWMFLYLLVLFGLLAWIRYFYGNIFMQTIQASVNFQVASRMFKDNSLLQKQLDTILYALYFLSAALLLMVAERKTHLIPYDLTGIGLFLFNLGLLIGIFFSRVVVVNVSGLIFNRIQLFREYLYNSFIFNKLLGIIMLPLLLLMVYTSGYLQEAFHWLALSIVGVIIGMRIIRGVIFTLRNDVLLFYLFLYLCALEIVPLALLYKWLQGIL